MSKLPGAEVQRGIWSSSEARAPGSEPLSFLTVQGVIFGSLDQVCVCVGVLVLTLPPLQAEA